MEQQNIGKLLYFLDMIAANIRLNLGKGFEFSIAQNVGSGSRNGLVEIALVDNRNDKWKFVPVVDWLYDPETIDADWQLEVEVEAWINADDLTRALKHATDYVRNI